jgi:hypothetical protein
MNSRLTRASRLFRVYRRVGYSVFRSATRAWKVAA